MPDAISALILVGGLLTFSMSLIYLRAFLRFKKDTPGLFDWEADTREDLLQGGGQATTPILEWATGLTQDHRKEFAAELQGAIVASGGIEPDRNHEVLTEWRATAELDVAPEIAILLRTPNKHYREWQPT